MGRYFSRSSVCRLTSGTSRPPIHTPSARVRTSRGSPLHSTTSADPPASWVEDTGEGDEIVCFSHGLLWSTAMYRPQVEALRGRYRCVAWDHRGQGRSDVPEGDEVSIETCTADAIALIEELGAPVHFVGLSMGGFVGMRLAARRPDLVKSLALLETAADGEPAGNIPKYRRLNLAARFMGVSSWLATQVMPIMFADAFLADPAHEGEVREMRRQMRANDNSVYKAVNGVIWREGCQHELADIRCPTMVLWSHGDKAIARERARALYEGIDGATWVEVPDAGHTSTIEAPEAVTAALREHFGR